MEIEYGSILEVIPNVQSFDGQTDIIILVDDTTNRSEYNCKVLDVSSCQLIEEFKDIEDFKNKNNIVRILGKISDCWGFRNE